jgi:hypothetical protein
MIMTRNQALDQGNDRGVSVAVTHVLAIGITTILIVGLLTAAGGLAEDEQDRSARKQLQMIGSSMANQIEKADTLGRRGANVSIRKDFQGTISGKSYEVHLQNGSDCNAPTIDTETCLVLSLTNSDVSTTVGVSNRSPLRFDHLGSGTIKIVSDPSGKSGSAPFGPDITSQIGIGRSVYDLPPPTGSKVTVNKPPYASLRMDPDMPMLGDVIIINASQSVDPERNIKKYVWNFTGGPAGNDPGQFNTTTTTPVLAVPAPQDDSLPGLDAGKFTVSLTVVDGGGLADQATTVFGVAGLVRRGPATAFDTNDGLDCGGAPCTEEDRVPGGSSFDVINLHDNDIEIRRIYVHPETDEVTRIDDDPVPSSDDDDDGSSYHEIQVGSGYIENDSIGSGMELNDGGLLLTEWDSSYPTIGDDGNTYSVEFTEFRENDTSDDYDSINMSGEPVEVRLFYYESANDIYYASRFNVTPNGSYFERQNSYGHKNWPNAPSGNTKTKKLQVDNTDYGTDDSYSIIATSEGWNKSNITVVDANPADKPNKKPKADVTYPHVDSTQWFVAEMELDNGVGIYTVRWYIEVNP